MLDISRTRLVKKLVIGNVQRLNHVQKLGKYGKLIYAKSFRMWSTVKSAADDNVLAHLLWLDIKSVQT